MNSDDALKNFLIKNDVKDEDLFYKFDQLEQENLIQRKKWMSDVNYFKKVKISAVALMKMMIHARSGGNLEVMGVMQGKIVDDTFIIIDAFALPVEGTETRVNAGEAANTYLIGYHELSLRVGRLEHLVGWYHSHPGYGCWLSGIDTSTQTLYQQHQDPWVAIVVDPTRTCAAGKVEIGAFRTYPEGREAGSGDGGGSELVPLDKVEDFGLHWRRYYQLQVEVFKSSSDTRVLQLLWNRHWTSTLATNPLLSNCEFHNAQISDVSVKLQRTLSRQMVKGGGETSDTKKIAKEGLKCASEQLQGCAFQSIKVTHTTTYIQTNI
eukprot:GHVR01043558.1.p1 GENE.GHVR01043558.1~~GHVR01043558.1.p1  ORF type:complete len:322 (-),score=79.48 GHVR01043558.1:89-1054(-)